MTPDLGLGIDCTVYTFDSKRSVILSWIYVLLVRALNNYILSHVWCLICKNLRRQVYSSPALLACAKVISEQVVSPRPVCKFRPACS